MQLISKHRNLAFSLPKYLRHPVHTPLWAPPYLSNSLPNSYIHSHLITYQNANTSKLYSVMRLSSSPFSSSSLPPHHPSSSDSTPQPQQHSTSVNSVTQPTTPSLSSKNKKQQIDEPLLTEFRRPSESPTCNPSPLSFPTTPSSKSSTTQVELQKSATFQNTIYDETSSENKEKHNISESVPTINFSPHPSSKKSYLPKKQDEKKLDTSNSKFNVSTEKHGEDESKSKASENKNTSSVSFSIMDKSISICLSELQLFFGSSFEYRIELFRWVKNIFTVNFVKYICPNYFDKYYFNREAIKGSKRALIHIFDHLSNKNFELLKECVESNLLKKFKSTFQTVHEHGYQLEMNIIDIPSSYISGMNLIFGIQRGNAIQKNKKQLHIVAGHHVISSLSSGLNAQNFEFHLKSPDYPQVVFQPSNESNTFEAVDTRKYFQEACTNGGILRMDVTFQTEQSIKLISIDKQDEDVVYLFPANAKHQLRFEMILDLIEDFKDDDLLPKFKGSSWKLVDFNNIMQGNYPIDFRQLKNVVT